MKQAISPTFRNTMRLQFLFFVFCFLLLQIVSAQQTVSISGKVLSKRTGQPISFCYVTALKTQHGVVTADDGSFLTRVDIGDTLVISFLGHLPYKIPCTENKQDVVVFLEEKVTALRPIIIRKFSKSSYVLKPETSQPKPKVYSNFPRPQTELQKTITMLQSPITAIYEAFSSKARDKRHYAELMQEYVAAKNKMNDQFLFQLSGIQDETLLKELFHHCKPDDFILQGATEYEIAEYIMPCIKDFKRKKGLEY